MLIWDPGGRTFVSGPTNSAASSHFPGALLPNQSQFLLFR